MSPTFNTGDLITDRAITASAAEHLHKGQIITFTSTSGNVSGSSLVITHRIFAVVKGPVVAGQQSVSYRTKGDANDAPDQNLVAPGAILGVYQQRVPYGGYVLSTLHQPITFVVLVMIPVVYLAEEEIRRRWISMGLKDAARRRANSPQQGDIR
jgi:signal peptidase